MTGQFVLSLSGRDKGRVHVVVACDPEKQMVFLVDGKTRKIEAPKPKKLKHIKFLSVCSEDISKAAKCGCLTNRAVREAIRAYEMNQE